MIAYFVWNLGVKQRPKNSRCFSKKYVLTLPPPPTLFVFFCGIVHCDTGSIGGSTPAVRWGGGGGGGGGGLKPFFSHINNIFAVNILSNTEKIPSLIAFYKLFLS